MELYRLLQLRVEVFVIEQACFYQDLDNKDYHKQTRHLLGDLDQELVAYARLLAPGTSYQGLVSIGRLVVAPQARGAQLGHQPLKLAIVACNKYWPQQSI